MDDHHYPLPKVTLRGLNNDYDPLPYTQGRIVAISTGRQVYDVELFEGEPLCKPVELKTFRRLTCRVGRR